MEDKLNKIIFLIEKLIQLEENKLKGNTKAVLVSTVNGADTTLIPFLFCAVPFNLKRTLFASVNIPDCKISGLDRLLKPLNALSKSSSIWSSVAPYVS